MASHEDKLFCGCKTDDIRVINMPDLIKEIPSDEVYVAYKELPPIETRHGGIVTALGTVENMLITGSKDCTIKVIFRIILFTS